MTAPHCRRCDSPMLAGILNAPAYCVECCSANPRLALENEESMLRESVRLIYEQHKVAAEQEAAPLVRRLIAIKAATPTVIFNPFDLLNPLRLGPKP